MEQSSSHEVDSDALVQVLHSSRINSASKSIQPGDDGDLEEKSMHTFAWCSVGHAAGAQCRVLTLSYFLTPARPTSLLRNNFQFPGTLSFMFVLMYKHTCAPIHGTQVCPHTSLSSYTPYVMPVVEDYASLLLYAYMGLPEGKDGNFD